MQLTMKMLPLTMVGNAKLFLFKNIFSSLHLFLPPLPSAATSGIHQSVLCIYELVGFLFLLNSMYERSHGICLSLSYLMKCKVLIRG